MENLKLVEEDHPEPRPGELLVRIRASSLNFHDDMVVLGKIPCADGRIPMTDGAGEVIAVGDDVEEFKVGDTVVSTFFPYWLGGEMTPATQRDVPGDSVDGYAREYRVHAGARLHEGTGRLHACGGGDASLRGSYRLERLGGMRPGEAR